MKERVLLSLTVLSGLILRLAEMNKVLTHDEAYTYVAFASKSLWHAVTDYSLPNNHIFHTILVYLSAELIGLHPWSIRIPALLGGMAVILAVYFLGKTLYSENAGLLAAALRHFSLVWCIMIQPRAAIHCWICLPFLRCCLATKPCAQAN